MMTTPSRIKYEKLDHREHVLKRPDTYLGSVNTALNEYYIFSDTNDNQIIKETLEINPGLIQIYIEALTNAVDNKVRSEQHGIKCKRLEIEVSLDTGKTKITNDGLIIPIKLDEKENMYIPELVFGNLLTSSNFDDTVERTIAGKNGIGITATNIYSKVFRARVYDHKTKELYEQVWSENMAVKSSPKISKQNIGGKGFVEVTYIPDFKLFGMTKYTKDTIRLMYYHAVVASMLSGISIKFNDKNIQVNNLQQFAKLFNPSSSTEEIAVFKGPDSSAVLIPLEGGRSIGFVNGIHTPSGGVHVDTWSQCIFKSILAKLETKLKVKLTIGDIKKYFMLFVKCVVDKPAFSGQFKDKLVAPRIEEPTISDTEIKKIMKWGVVSLIKDSMKKKDFNKIKCIEKKKGVVMDSYDPSNKRGSDCTLILTEGLSAKTFAIKGITNVGCFGRKGRNYFGVFSLRGKCLNIRNCTPDIIAKNNEISAMINIIGLKVGVDYRDDKNFKTLRYGRVLILADADVDGSHIASLIINFIHYLYPTLLQRKDAFLYNMLIPVIKLTRGKTVLPFYNMNDYHNYSRNNNCNKCVVKYFKGLGTSTDAEINECFGKRVIQFTYDGNKDSDALRKAFQKDLSDLRKMWIKAGKRKVELNEKVSISDFIDSELIEYSLDDCHRSLPNIVDGLKESQRKIMYACFLKNLTSELKVAQLAGYVAEKTKYHHGESNLCDTIVCMAQDFVGSNNIPLLEKGGEFGTRTSGGQDAAQARYIFTSLRNITRAIFNEKDDCLLDYINDEGFTIEPTFYVPVIPMILINGGEGIGTGWSCKIPCYNPLDVIECVEDWVHGREVRMIHPWYKGYKGVIEQVSDSKYKSCGVVVRETSDRLRITELPIGVWTDMFKVHIEKMLVDGVIRGRLNNSTSDNVDFQIDVPDDFDVNQLKLVTYLHTGNMVCYNDKGELIRYKTVVDIINAFCSVRYDYYLRRKKAMIDKLVDDIRFLNNKYRFLKGVISRDIDIMNIQKDVIVSRLLELGIDKKDDSYDYLIKLPINSFTCEKMMKLNNKLLEMKQQLQTIENTSEKSMWLQDLENVKNEYSKLL